MEAMRAMARTAWTDACKWTEKEARNASATSLLIQYIQNDINKSLLPSVGWFESQYLPMCN